ncbi:hypothetical protein ATANTOWER_008830 [Ataeniobius toweri]|uniref:Uncharacterized protein n=1 Tax=Ataeniobius toweri TaxID=208326 RepID=A0ABU7BAF4_9TELE|nr:hypothetical protein [Ataeniobius toweri]
MTEHSGQADTAETLKRTLSEHSHQIQAQGSSVRSLHEQQRQTNQQLEQISSLLQHVLSTKDSPSPGGATEPLLSQQLPSGRDVTSPNLEKFSGEIRDCGGFLLQFGCFT